MAITQGTYAVGADPGADPTYDGWYADWEAALSDIGPTMTGDLTLVQNADVTEAISASPIVTVDTNGNKLKLTSDTPHLGDPTAGHLFKITSTKGVGITIQGSGDFELENLRVEHQVNSRESTLNILQSSASHAIEIHDVLIDLNNTSIVSSSAALRVYLQAAVQSLSVWNVLVSRLGGGWHGIEIDGAPNSKPVNIENCAVVGGTIASYMGGITADPTLTGVTVRNCVVLMDSGPCFATNLATAAAGYNNASSDDTADDFASGSGAYLNVVGADEFESLVWNDPDFMKVKEGGDLADGGITVAISENTAGIRGNPRPHSPYVSVGPDEFAPPIQHGLQPNLTNFATRPGIEGPQIIATWDLPTDPGTSEFKIRKRRYTYPLDYADGIEVLHDTTMTKTSVVDYGILANVIWCYQGFVKYTCKTMWDDITSYLVGDRIIPITSNGYFYECITAGDSDSGEPTWPTTIGATVEDGTVVWETKNTNPGWETNNTTSRASDFTWDSEYMTHVLFGLLPSLYRGEDAKSDQVALEVQEDPDDDNERRAYHEDGTVNRGQLERFLMIFGSVASRIKGAIDFMAQLINADECPPKYLPRLASVLGVTIDGELPVDAQRAAIRNAVAIYRQKGTETGLERALRSAVDIANVNVDAMSKHVLVSNRVAKQSAIFAEKWEATKGYILGAVVAPSDNFGALGRVFECTTAGTSGGTEPQWVPAWVLNTAYSVGDVIVPTSVNGRAYVCTAAGTSAGTEPTWPTNLGETVVDGTVTWTVDNPPAAGFGATFSDGTAEWTTVVDESIYDWADSQAGHSWELPTFDSYGRVTAEANLYSFEILRLWFILASGEELTSGDTERIARMMNEFAPADTRYVIRVEGP